MARLFLVFGLLLSACATGQLPATVQRFVDRRDACDHWRGEIDGPTADKEREREIQAGIEEFCIGTDKQLAVLRGKYSDNQPVLERLSKYETRIESRSK